MHNLINRYKNYTREPFIIVILIAHIWLLQETPKNSYTNRYTYLKKALHILQYVHSTVAEVVLLWHFWVGTFHDIFGKASFVAFPYFPFHL